LESIIERGMLPSDVTRMRRQEFKQRFGAVLEYSSIQPRDEREEMKAFVIEQYGNNLSAIKRNNPGYRSICYQAGREPNDLDDYVDMVMQLADEDEDLVEKLADWGEKKFLYWAEKGLLNTWMEAFFRYAALKTLLATNSTPQNLLTAVGVQGLPGL